MKEWTPEWLVDKFKNPDNNDDVLSGIETVPWKSLNHAYGSASDVPALFRALFSKNFKHGEFAIHLLFGNVWHQGTVYEATRFVSPFLIQIIQSDSVFLTHRISLVHLLECMSNGNSYIDVHYPTPEEFHKINKDRERDYETSLKSELRNVKLARESVLAQKDSLLQLLTLTEQELAWNIYLLLGTFKEFSRELFPIFVEHFYQEKSEEGKQVILEALRSLGYKNNMAGTFFNQVIRATSSLEIRAIAALALIESQEENDDSAAFDTLLNFVRFRVKNKEEIEEMPSWKFVHGEVISLRNISTVLINLSSFNQLDKLQTYILVLENSDDIFDCVQRLFFQLFEVVETQRIFSVHSSDNGKLIRKFHLAGLKEISISPPYSPIKKEYIGTLRMILTLPKFWEVESNMLNAFGIPHSRNEIEKLLIKTTYSN